MMNFRIRMNRFNPVCLARLYCFLLRKITVLTVVFTASNALAQTSDAEVTKQVEAFLHEYYKGFELEDVNRLTRGVTEDFTGVFYIPRRKKDPILFDKRGIMEGFTQAISLYKGKSPQMKISQIVVVARSENEAAASYKMDFYLEGEWKNAALSISDLRREGTGWKIYRHYENKRR
jgi:hypothetical protein